MSASTYSAKFTCVAPLGDIEPDSLWWLDHPRRNNRLRSALPGEPIGTVAFVRRRPDGTFVRLFAPRLRLLELADDDALIGIVFDAFAKAAERKRRQITNPAAAL